MFKELFDKCIEDGKFKTKKALDKKNKRMVVYVQHDGTNEENEWFSLEHSYKGDKPTPEEAEEMYKSLFCTFAKSQLLSYARGQAIDPKGRLRVVNGKDYEE